ncbi:hypothetical protein [Corynebacterium aurimucosum]|uniref:hypothetical protein n=1 Tax=Corynebacterium aurimucosum TaxID=169292 RepID=UPI003990D79A
MLLPGIDAAAQRVDVAEAAGAEWVFMAMNLQGDRLILSTLRGLGEQVESSSS